MAEVVIKNVVKTDSPDSVLVTVVYERSVADNMAVMEENFKNGNISADPNADFPLAMAQQLALELQGAADEQGVEGFFQVTAVEDGKSFH